MKECVIRADGNANIGAGHLMRCLTIAKAMRNRQSESKIVFLCADGQSAELVKEHGFEADTLHTDYRNMEAELPALQRLFQNRGGKRIIMVDSYYATEAYLKALREFGRTVLLDDMQRLCYPVDVVINYNAFADAAVYAGLYAGKNTRLLVGSRFVPVREQFLHKHYRLSDTVKSVLITTGGGDRNNIAGKIIQKILEIKSSDKINIHLITGRYNPHIRELKQIRSCESGLYIHCDVKDMASLMLNCDLAITAGGTTVYELAAIGVPFICFSYAENQEALTEYIGEERIAGFAGAYHREPVTTLSRIKQLFTDFYTQPELRKACYERERALIDGLGAQRLAENIWKEA